MGESDEIREEQSSAASPETVEIANGSDRPMLAVILAVLSTVLAFVTVTVTTGGGLSFGFSFVSAIAGGFNGAYMTYALLWDLFFVAGPMLALAGVCMWNQNTKKLLIAAVSMGVAILVLNLAFGLFAMASGISALKYFSLLEYVVLVAQTNAFSLFLQALVYGGAFAVFLVAVKAKKNQAKIAVVGFSIVAVLALVLTVAGLQPFAYSIGGYSVLGYSVPKAAMYFLNEILSYVLLWAAAAIYVVKTTKDPGLNANVSSDMERIQS